MKRYFFITIIFYAVFLTFASYSMSKAYFSDMAVLGSNTFTAAAEFPQTPPDGEPGPEGPGPSIVINEIMWMGANADVDDEWLELRNTTDSPIDLTGWKLEGAASSSTIITIGSGNIPANGFFVIANQASSSSMLDIEPDMVTTSIQLDNSDAQITLKNASNEAIDRADDGSDAPFAGTNSPNKSSMERNSTLGDGTVSSNWHSATTQTNLDSGRTEFATPKAANSL